MSSQTPSRITLSARLGRTLCAVVATLLFATPAMAIHPQQWLQTTEADYADGESQQVVVTNLGDLKLAARTTQLAELPEATRIIQDLQRDAQGRLYLAAGPQAKLLIQTDDGVQERLSLDNEQIFCLSLFKGNLLLGISGENTSRLATYDGQNLTTLTELPGVRYIWDMLVRDEVIYVATGIQGKLLKVDTTKPIDADQAEPADEDKDAPAEGNDDDAQETTKPAQQASFEITVLLDAAQSNLLCLGRDAQGQLYVGSDTEGLVYRLTIDEAGKVSTFVLYDAPEPEIGALLVQPDGTVYAGTADANQARPGRLNEASDKQTGRPEAPAPRNGQQPPPPGPDHPDQPEPPQVPPAPEPAGDQPTRAATPAPAAAADAPPAGGDVATVPPVEAPPVPTAAQRDQLRDVIRQRLIQARESGPLQAGAGLNAGPVGRGGTPSRAARANAAASKQGNAIYRIGPDHFVSEVFRESVMILRIMTDPSADADGKLLVATGNEGQLFRVDPTLEETTILLKLDAMQIPAMIRDGDNMLLATANPATLVRMQPGHAAEGTYTSSVHDAGHTSMWGTLRVTASMARKGKVKVQLRSGNVQDPEQAPWSAWSEPVELTAADVASPLQPVAIKFDTPPARFVQYRLTLAGDTQTSPVIDSVNLTYVTPNRRPKVTAVTAAYGQPNKAAGKTDELPPRQTELNIKWEAADPNEDKLIYNLSYRPAEVDVWLPLVEDHAETNFDWDTKRVPDGRYLLRVVASDKMDNPGDMAMTSSRRSEPILVDNTPPDLARDPQVTVEAGVVRIRFTAKDALSALESVHYAVDSTDDWQVCLPADLIYDSTEESFDVSIVGLSPGPHVVTLRVVDGRSNSLYQALRVDVPGPEAKQPGN